MIQLELFDQLPGAPASPRHLEPEKLVTLAEAARVLGVRYWQVQRAVRRGDIPSYRPFNTRRLVRHSEVLAFIEASRTGGSR